MHAIPFVNDIVLAFPSLLLMREIPNHGEINPALAELLLADRIADPTPSTSAIGGWQSARDLVVRGNPAVATLMSHVGSAVLQLTSVDFGSEIDPAEITLKAEAWGNIMDDGDFSMIHNHVRDDWSGVYYVDAEGGRRTVDRNGALELVDPRALQPLTGPGRFRRPFREVTVQPKNGLMVVFPSWMKHYVYPYRGDRERISIAFNVKVGFVGSDLEPET
jgi:uncharacterized protein (TIGR02466 family)